MKDQKIHETHQEKNGLEKEGFSTTTHNHEAVNKNINLKKETKQ